MTEVRLSTLDITELENLDLKTVTENGQRFYTDTEGTKRYPSVTTVVGLESREHIKAWRKRVGEEKANKITKSATSRGTTMHQHVEDYLRQEKDFIEFDNLIHEGMFKGIRPVLDEIIPLALEAPMYSDNLKMAGRVDCIGMLDDVLCIIDFKTSSKFKEDYMARPWFLQMTAYALMVEELTGKKIEEIVALVMLENGTFQIFTANHEDYIDDLCAVRLQYKNLYGI